MDYNNTIEVNPMGMTILRREELVAPTEFEEAEIIPAETTDTNNTDAGDENDENPAFIESNTNAITLKELEETCIVPSFADGQLTISMPTFVKRVHEAAIQHFKGETISAPELRVSHKIMGRIPTALNKKENELLPTDRTQFYQRMCFCMVIKSMSREINGQKVYLTIGGVRSYNEDNLFTRKSPEKMRIFIAWRVRVCSNLMLNLQDGLRGSLEVMSDTDIYESALRLFQQFNPEENLRALERLTSTKVSIPQFCQIVGRLRLYQNLPISQQKELPKILLVDTNINSAVNGFVNNKNFGLNGRDYITCFDLMQLLNEAAKQSYIDKFLERNQNATDFSFGIQNALEGRDTENYQWFLN